MAQEIQKKRIAEKSACAYFLKHVFQIVDSLWPQVLENIGRTGVAIQPRLHKDDAAVELAWAIIAANLTHLPALLPDHQMKRVVNHTTDLLAEIEERNQNPAFLVNNYIKAANEAAARSFPPVVGIAALLYQRADLGGGSLSNSTDVYAQNPEAVTYLCNLIRKITWWDRFLTEYVLVPPRSSSSF